MGRDCSEAGRTRTWGEAAVCGGRSGYVHLEYQELDRVCGSGILECVPATPLWRGAAGPSVAQGVE